MDELVRHCLRELSFDGDLGCDTSRLRDFITEFYSHPSSSRVQGQTVDDAFCAFVWSVIVQQPGVRVGTIPPGVSTEVYIAPQPSAIKRAKAKGEDTAAAEEPVPATGLNIITDAALRPLEDLRQEYEDKLRIAADPETTFAALTGSHIRPSKLTPMIYTALQIVTRGREHGVSVLELGKKSGYDQKSCFYIIKQLVDLGLVVKLRQPGVSTNICVHKYFYERSPIWQQVVTEEKKAVSEGQTKEDGESDEDTDQEETKPFTPVQFDPIDSRHLSSMPLLRSRLAKLLKNCPHNMHTSNNLMTKIGFMNPTRTDRRFFRARLHELMDQGFIDKVQVPHVDRKRFPDKKVSCIRLLTEDTASQSQGEVIPMEDVNLEESELETYAEDYTSLKMNVSLHRQIIDCLAEAGTMGMTLNELSAALGDFDRRTIDLLINRLEKDPPPAHLADLGIAQLTETHGRERRYKYFTVAHYIELAEREQFEDRRYRDVDMSAVGGYLSIEADVFYQDDKELNKRMEAMSVLKKDGATPKAKAKKKYTNPILPDGSVKRGRPKKSAVGEDGAPTPTPSKKGKKRKREETEGSLAIEGAGEPPAKKKRGRPPKKAVGDGESGVGPSQGTPATSRNKGKQSERAANPDKQGGAVAGPFSNAVQESVSQAPTPKKRRGRPKKIRASADCLLPPTDEPSADPDGGERRVEHLSIASVDVSMLDVALSSPLSSIPASPMEVAEESEQTSAAPVGDLESSTYAEASTSQSVPPEDSSAGLRRSTRTPKVRRRGDSLSPQRQSARQTLREASAAALATAPSASSLTQPEVEGRLDQVEQSSPPDIPIDPALLQTHGLSSLVQDHPLIAMTPAPELPETGPSTTLEVSRKRDQPETPLAGTPAKRTRSSQADKSRKGGNISQSRRENELLRLLAEADGIMNTSHKEFYDAHAALVETITKAGETASSRLGTRIDKRTLDTTLKDLEARGKIKLLTTSVPTLTGSARMARVAYLPETPSDALNVFMAELGQNLQSVPATPSANNLKTLDEPIDYGGGRKKQGRARPPVIHEQADSEVQEVRVTNLAQLFQQDDKTIRDALLTEKNTVAQMYGYIVGKAARARALHSLTIGLFEKGAMSPQIVSLEHRIVHLSYYFADIPLSAYCSLVAVLYPNEELGQLLQSPAGHETPVGAVTDSLRSALAPAHAKSRSRILSLMDILQTLGLVTPLVPSESPNATFVCAPNAQHPTAFEIAPPGPYTPAIAPLYWRFNDIAPIRLWALGESLPPIWKMAPSSTSEQTVELWRDLERVSTDPIYAQELLGATPTSAGDASDDIAVAAKTLRRPISWSAVYSLSFLQTEYLRRYIDPATSNTPLEDESAGEEQLDRLSRIVSASKDVVANWFQKARKKYFRDLKKLKNASTKGKGKAKREAREDAGTVLARRAAEAKEQRERDWEDMLQRVHADELIASAAQRVQRVKAKFLQGSGKASERWEARISEAIKEADMVVEKLLSTARAPLFPPMPVAKPALPAAVAVSVQEKDVDELIASQGPRVSQNARTGKKSKKGKEKDTGEGDVKTPRRHRFLWNRDYDELVRDASAIIKARCRGSTRLDWGAMEQIFPAVPRNSVRQRLVHLKETPGTETYLARLEDKWHELWVQHRGTDVLPDLDPESATGFDLATHIKFLRKHIDKNAIRVGFVEAQDSQKVDLPSSLEEIRKHYDIVEKVPSVPLWDFMWSVVAEEAREKQFATHAFTAELEDIPPAASYDSDFLQVADAAVKMALGNPNETYDADAASSMLKGVGEDPVRQTTTELLNRGVLAKTVRDPTKSKPGRMLKVSETNLNSLGGQLHRELFQDASALEELVGQQEQHRGSGIDSEQWQEWPLLATDGDTAFLLELTSENKVRFDVDTSHPQSMRTAIDWNSKKADDDDIETAVRVCYVGVAEPVREAFIPEPPVTPSGGVGTEMAMDVDLPSDLEHGKTVDGILAFCRRSSEGLVDCVACLEHARTSLLQELGKEDMPVAESILVALQEAGSIGLTKQQLLTKLEPFGESTLSSVIQRLTDTAIPLAHWTGYAAIVLVSASAIRPWTVTVKDAPESDHELMIFPRRWLDIYGRKLDEVWDAALHAVLGLVLLRPGISQAEIRWRLRSAYDRQDVCEALQTLQEERYITPRVHDVRRTFEGAPVDQREEKVTFWFLSDCGRRWYQV